MITNNGKEIIAKYLMGIAPAYASYVAVGCGTKPRYNTTNLTSTSSATSAGVTTVTIGGGLNTEYVWIGAKITVVSGTGQLYDLADTIITKITGSSTFIINHNPIVELSGATILVQADPSKNVLDFEMFRVPISSRGYIDDNGVNKIIFTAELPTEERYEISEVGIFSAGSNSIAGSYDSKTVYAFANTEGWTYNNGSTIFSPGSTDFPYVTGTLINGSNVITKSTVDNIKVIQTNANNLAFTTNDKRMKRYERCRYFNNLFMVRGDTSHINSSFKIQPNAGFLEITGQSVDFSKNSTSDLLKACFSLINVYGDSDTLPDNVRLTIQFANSSGTQYANLNIDVPNSENYFGNNRYKIIEKRLDELTYSNPFSWNNVDTVRVYSSVLNTANINHTAATSTTVTLQTALEHNFKVGDVVVVSGVGSRFDGTHTITAVSTSVPYSFSYDFAGTTSAGASISPVFCEASSQDYYVALDALRFDNISSLNPLYGLVGYSVIQNSKAETIIKDPNSNNYIEFRFTMDVT